MAHDSISDQHWVCRLGRAPSVRKRKWITRLGEAKETWVVNYTDQQGVRRLKTFDRKKDADAYHATVKVEVREGRHTPVSQSITVATAAADWLAYVEAEGRERSTREQYEGHLRIHIAPDIGNIKLAHLTTPRVEKFRDDLLLRLSRPMARKVLGSLKALLKDAKRRGNVAQNAAADTTIGIDRRGKRKVEAGKDFPLISEVKAMLDVAQGRRRAVTAVAALAGLRSSEIRGLRWQDVDLKRGVIRVEQRVDRYSVTGEPKSAAGRREIPIGPCVVNTLREWLLQSSHKAPGDFVFATRAGTAEYHAHLIVRILGPAQVAAGVVDGEARAKYSPHQFRHFHASWLIARQRDGGLELPLREVQSRLGHATLSMTADRYGHLFPRADHEAEMVEAERRAGFF
jgi:integrase